MEFQKTVEVDGQSYKMHCLGPSKAFKLGARLTKFVGEPMAQMAAAGGDEMQAVQALPKAVGVLVRNLHEDEVLNIVKELISTCTHNNAPIVFEQHFQGKLGTLIKLTVEVVKYQFEDFTSAIGQTVAEAMGPKEK